MDILFAILFGLVSMIAYGASNVFSKTLSQKFGAPRTIFLRGLILIVILGIAAIPTYQYLNNWTVSLAAIAVGIFGYLPVLAFTHAIKTNPLGIMSPIANTSPIFTLLLSFLFIGLILNPGQWVAIVIIIAANIAMSVDVRNLRQSNLLKLSSGIPYAFAAAVGWGLFYFFLVPISKASDPWLAAFLIEMGVTIAAAVHIGFSSKKFMLKQVLQPRLIFNAILICVGTMAFIIGVKYFNVGIVVALSSSTALVATILGYYLFKEKLQIKDRITAAIIIAGVAALSLL